VAGGPEHPPVLADGHDPDQSHALIDVDGFTKRRRWFQPQFVPTNMKDPRSEQQISSTGSIPPGAFDCDLDGSVSLADLLKAAAPTRGA